jgi:ankyrin repeat protein
LLDRGANIHAEKDAALRWAAENGHTKTVKLLLDRGADVQVQDNVFLCTAVRMDYIRTVKLLLDRGANVHTDEDDAALSRAAHSSSSSAKIKKLLLTNGAKIAHETADQKRAALRYEQL